MNTANATLPTAQHHERQPDQPGVMLLSCCLLLSESVSNLLCRTAQGATGRGGRGEQIAAVMVHLCSMYVYEYQSYTRACCSC